MEGCGRKEYKYCRTIERGRVPRRLSETNEEVIIIYSLQKQQVIHEGVRYFARMSNHWYAKAARRPTAESRGVRRGVDKLNMKRNIFDQLRYVT
jgi:hypothetical protein